MMERSQSNSHNETTAIQHATLNGEEDKRRRFSTNGFIFGDGFEFGARITVGVSYSILYDMWAHNEAENVCFIMIAVH